MTLFGTRRQPVAEPAPPQKAETCIACGEHGGPMQLIPVEGYDPQWVCVRAGECLDRAGVKR